MGVVVLRITRGDPIAPRGIGLHQIAQKSYPIYVLVDRKRSSNGVFRTKPRMISCLVEALRVRGTFTAFMVSLQHFRQAALRTEEIEAGALVRDRHRHDPPGGKQRLAAAQEANGVRQVFEIMAGNHKSELDVRPKSRGGEFGDIARRADQIDLANVGDCGPIDPGSTSARASRVGRSNTSSATTSRSPPAGIMGLCHGATSIPRFPIPICCRIFARRSICLPANPKNDKVMLPVLLGNR